jgi:hypothetical protein
MQLNPSSQIYFAKFALHSETKKILPHRYLEVLTLNHLSY